MYPKYTHIHIYDTEHRHSVCTLNTHTSTYMIQHTTEWKYTHIHVIVRSWGVMVYGICTSEGVYVIPRASSLVSYSAKDCLLQSNWPFKASCIATSMTSLSSPRALRKCGERQTTISSFLLLNNNVKACLWTEKDLVMCQQRKPVCVLEELPKKKHWEKRSLGAWFWAPKCLDFDDDLLDHLHTQAGWFSTQLRIYNVPSF